MLVSNPSFYAPLGYGSLGSSLRIRAPRERAAALPPTRAGANIRDLVDLTSQLRRAVQSLRDAMDLRKTGSASRAALAQSSDPLSISTVSAAASLSSSDQINAITTSFSPRGPSFSGSSSASPTIGGVYDGDQGDDQLTFHALLGGVVGVSIVRLEVRDGQGQAIETVDFNLGYTPGTEQTLSNGLTVSLGSGTVAVEDTFAIEVSASEGSRVDPSKPFNGTRNENPNFEPSFSVTAGVIEINGVQVAVAADDSIHSLLAKITASEAGVIATFDDNTETVDLTQKTLGSAHSIALGADTTGFFAATKLTTATVTPGSHDDRTRVIASVTALSAISSGTFGINGVTFNVDVGTDSLNDVLTRINESTANVSASITATNGLRVVSTGGGQMTLDDGSSNLFSALGITAGQFEPSTGGKRESRFRRPVEVRERIDDLGDGLNRLFKTTFSPGAATAASQVRAALRSSLADALGGESNANTLRGHGLEFRFDDPSDGVFSWNLRRVRRAMKHDPEAVAALLGDLGRGLRGSLDDALENVGSNLRALSRAAAGQLVDASG